MSNQFPDGGQLLRQFSATCGVVICTKGSCLSSCIFCLAFFLRRVSVSVCYCGVLLCCWCCVLGVVSLWWCDTLKTPCVRSKCPHECRLHAHMCFNICAWCLHTRGRFESTHGGVQDATPHRTHTMTTTTHTTQHSITHNITRRRRKREKKTEEERQDKRRQMKTRQDER